MEWGSGRVTHRSTIEERARFDFVRYANCWEDADILLEALQVRKGGLYLSVSSAGDNTLSILGRGPALVVTADISPAQLACVELRKAAFLNLSHGAVLQFLGVREGSGRMRTYERLRGSINETARQFWDGRRELIEAGVIHSGKFEHYFRLFRNVILPFIHGRQVISDLLKPRDAEARREFYAKRWDSLRWRLLFRFFFSRTLLGRLGRDPEFFRYIEGSVAAQLLDRARHALTTLPTERNPYLHFIVRGNFGAALPFYLREENFEAIRGNLDSLVLFEGTVDEAIQAHPDVVFDGFNLSDIFEYMSFEEYLAGLDRIVRSARNGARLVYWNMLADRKSPPGFRNRLEALDGLANELHLQDKAFFYKALVIEQVRML
ncbi:MAG: BtaA family protein [Syntrophobacteraceae bacterium]|jgi:S-adenosylmethionine-diacylglycerol 3-amino-3-carboxypropyl transferase|nr:BtaA family protein [Syntrophobacteraceae bacterium]